MERVKKGLRIDHFLELVRREFPQLRGVSVDQLLFIKEDVIIPQVTLCLVISKTCTATAALTSLLSISRSTI